GSSSWATTSRCSPSRPCWPSEPPAAGPSGRPCWPGDLPACPRPADVDLANSPRLWSLHRGESGKSANSPRWSDHKRRFLPAAPRRAASPPALRDRGDVGDHLGDGGIVGGDDRIVAGPRVGRGRTL